VQKEFEINYNKAEITFRAVKWFFQFTKEKNKTKPLKNRKRIPNHITYNFSEHPQHFLRCFCICIDIYLCIFIYLSLN